MSRLLLFLGAVNAAVVVAAGAYGAHALKEQPQAALFQTATQYHMFHALGLLAIGVVGTQRPESTLLGWAGGLMFVGIVLFCGSLYVNALGSYRLGVMTPFGGMAFIVSWLLFAVAALRS